jgi:vacuolar-type H+-ATPase subunit E/Vma4
VLSKCYANNYYYKTREDVVGLIQKIGDENLRVYFNTKRKYAVKGRVKGRI